MDIGQQFCSSCSPIKNTTFSIGNRLSQRHGNLRRSAEEAIDFLSDIPYASKRGSHGVVREYLERQSERLNNKISDFNSSIEQSGKIGDYNPKPNCPKCEDALKTSKIEIGAKEDAGSSMINSASSALSKLQSAQSSLDSNDHDSVISNTNSAIDHLKDLIRTHNEA